jgi:hypothetical protein
MTQREIELIAFGIVTRLAIRHRRETFAMLQEARSHALQWVYADKDAESRRPDSLEPLHQEIQRQILRMK